MGQPFRALGADHHTALTRLNLAAAPHTVLSPHSPSPLRPVLAEHYEQRCLYVFDVLPEPVFPDGRCACEVGH